MPRPIIAIDIDDVLSASAAAFIEFSNARWGTTLTLDDYDEDWARMWRLDHSNTDHIEIVRQRGDEILVNSIRHMKHDVHAYDVLKRLKEDFELIVVTSRRTSLKGDTLAWIQEHYEGIFTEDTVYFTGFYDELNSGSWHKTKGDVLEELSVSYLIDDQVKHCNSAAVHGIKALQFGGFGPQLSQPLEPSVYRVKNWQEVAEFFDAERQRI